MKRILPILCAGLVLLLLTSSALGQGEDLAFGKNKVQYQYFTWYYIQSEHYDIYYYDLGLHIAEFAAKTLEEATPRLEKTFNYQTKKRIPIILYNSPNTFQQTNVTTELIEENVGGFTEAFKNRVVIPFDGSYEHFRHVLTHELTHAFTFDLLYGDLLGNLLSAEYVQEPLWFAEGFAEYFSLGGMDIEGDMILRDGSINGYLVPLEFAGGFLVYKEGQSAIKYIVDKYGQEKIAEILHQAKTKRSFEKSLKSAIGLDESELDDEWLKNLKKEYWPEIAQRKEPKDFAKQLTNHQKDGSYLNEKPAFSPLGDRIAIFSDRKDYTEIYIISAIDGKVIDKVVKGERSGDLESLHSYVSGLSWSPDGRDITFVSKSHGKDVLCLVDVKKKKIYRKFKFNLESLLSPSWSADGGSIVFTGVMEGRTDLYLTDIKTGSLQKLTDDDYDDREAAWSPDGKTIAFSSDRPAGAKNDSTYTYGHYNIFLLDPATRQIKPLTQSGEDNLSPTFSPDGKRICFTSTRNGISNLYIQDLDSLQSYPVSNILSGCFTPSWSKDGAKIAFTSFYKGGWDIYLLKEIKPATESEAPLLKTALILEKEKPAEAPADTTQKKAEPQAEKKLDLSYYVFKSTEEKLDSLAKPLVPAEKETLATKFPPGVYTPKKYKLKFTPDIVSGNVGYSTFFGFQGQSFLAVSDLMGNHNFFLATDLFNTIDQSNFQLLYFYLPRRIDYGIGIFHTKYYYVDDIDRLFSDRFYGLTGLLSRPFSTFSRIDLSVTHLSIDRVYYDPDTLGIFDDRSIKTLLTSISWVQDNVLWGITGPVNGRRSIFTFEWSPDITDRSIPYTALWMDYRRYTHFGKNRFEFAFRLTAGRSDGKQPRHFYLGGVGNWIGPDLATQNIYTLNDLYFSSLVTPLRGYDYFQFKGTRYFLSNFEFRYPFIQNLTFGFPPLSLRYITGAMFLDIGSAWTNTKAWQGGTSEGGSSRLKDIKTGFGFGARINLGIFVLRYDAGWSTDFASVSAKPIHYFSLGAEF